MRRNVLLFAVIAAATMCRIAFAVTISGFSPAFGRPGNVITVNGSGFTTATNLVFNPAAPVLGDFTIVSDSQLIGVVPIGATSGTLSVATTSSGTAPSSSTFLVAPAVSSFSPQVGMPGTAVYIGGANFIVGGTTVTFSGTTTPVTGTVTASTVVGVTVPSGATTGPVTVATSAGSTVSTIIFTTGNAPTITSFSPTVGGAGSNVVISGGNFINPTVTIGGKTASATVSSTTELNATVPAGATTGPIEVSTAYGSFTTSSNFGIGSGVIVTGFSPTIGTDNTVETIIGTGLSTIDKVTFNGHSGIVTGGSATLLQVTVPNASGTGPIEVSNFITATNFTNTTGPFIAAFNPALSEVGSNVIISGFNFTHATAVKFGSTAASTFTVSADTEINATVPSGAVSAPITVTSNSTGFTTASNFVVAIAGTPLIATFSPTNGVRGTVVTVNGGNFTGLSSIQFNGVSASYAPLTSSTTVNATVPGTATTGLIGVTSGGKSGLSPGLFYLQPWITNATASGFVNSSVVIQGRSLTNASSVQVNGVNYSFTNSPTQIVAAVPANATSGPIIVTTPGGIFINSNSFIVLPDVYSFTPTIGPAGTVVTVDGTSFSDVTSVKFNGTSAMPVNITSNQLQVTVPTGATSGSLTLLVPGGQDVSSNSFTVTSNSTVNLSKTVTPVIVGPGTNVTYTLIVTNKGPSIVTYVTVTDNIPSGFNVTSSSSSVGTTLITNSTVVATLGTLATNAGVTITVKGTSTTPEALTNTANLGFTEGETVYGTNYAFAFAYIINSAERTLSAARLNSGEVLVTWPASAVSFNLQVSTNLAVGNGWQNVSGGPVVTNGLNEYSNSIPASSAEFFRLEVPQ